MKSKCTRLILCLLTTCVSGSLHAAEQHTVIFESQTQQIDHKEPWKRQNTRTINNLGLYIGDGRFLTTYQTIYYAKSVTAQKIGDFRKVNFAAFTSDRDLNLAILEAEPEEQAKAEYKQWIASFTKASFTDELPVSSDVTVHRLGQYLTVKQVGGRIRDIVNIIAGYGYYRAPMYSMDGALVNDQSYSEIITQKNKVAGLASYVHSGALYVLPSTMLKDYIARSLSGEYTQIPSVYFSGRASINPFERGKLQVPEGMNDGIFISSIDPVSPFSNKLQVNDLIVSANGQRINYKAEVSHSTWDSISVTYLLKRLKLGEELTLDVFRAGERLPVSVKMNLPYDPQKFLVPPYFVDHSANYLIVGGLVFHNLSKQFMEQWGGDWKQSAPVDLVKEAAFMGETVLDNGEEKVVVLSQVLPMDMNNGYHGIKNFIVSSVNNTTVKNLQELKMVLSSQPVEKFGKKFMVFNFKYEGLKLILDYEAVNQSRTVMVKQFSLPQDASIF